jgi:hypothetical protein
VLEKNRAVIEGAAVVARESGATAVILAGWLPEERRYLESIVAGQRSLRRRTRLQIRAASRIPKSSSCPRYDCDAVDEQRLRCSRRSRQEF